MSDETDELADLACRLMEEGPFELYRGEDAHKSKKVWLTEYERDTIVGALWVARTRALQTTPPESK